MPLVIFSTWTTLEFTPLCFLKIDLRAILLFGFVLYILPWSNTKVPYLRAGSVLPQVVALVLTLFKYRAAIREGWGKTPIVTRLTRDGTGIVVAIIGAYSPTQPPTVLLWTGGS